MKIVIDIPEEELYKIEHDRVITDEQRAMLFCAIKCGTVLPQGHGDLIDRNILLQNWKVIPSRDRLIFDRYIQALNAVIPADKK